MKRIPGRFHPGEYLHDELQARDDSETVRLANRIGGQKLLNLLVCEESVTEEIASALSDVLGIEAEFWLNLQAAYDKGEKKWR